MELGTGIFLSAIFLGTLALFIATKDRWNWKKILLWPLGIILGLALIGGSIGYAYQWYENRPKKLTELWGVSLNDTEADVKFKKGEPTKRYDDDIWAYRPYATIEGDYVIYFKNSRVRAVIYFGSMLNAPSVHGVGNYDSVHELEANLGPPSYVSRSKDEIRRAYSFDKFNIVVHFEKGNISALGINDPALGPFKYIEEADGK